MVLKRVLSIYFLVTFQIDGNGSLLRPLLFNIYLNDLFSLVEATDVFNFADDSTFVHVKMTQIL